MDEFSVLSWTFIIAGILGLLLWIYVLFGKYSNIKDDQQKQSLYISALLLGPVPIFGFLSNIYAACKL